MRAINILWKKSKLTIVLNAILILIALYYAFAAFVLPQLELKIAIAGLAIVLLLIVSTDFQHAKDAEKNRQDFG